MQGCRAGADNVSMAMTSLPSIALSGRSAAALRLDVSAHNVANAETQDFRRQFVQQESQPTGGVASQVARAPEPGVDLAREMVDQMSASYAFKANLRVIRTNDEMLGSLLDLHA